MNFIHPTAIIGPNVSIGNNVYIGPYCIIGDPPEFKGKEHLQCGVRIGNNIRITGLVTIDSGTENPTVIGNNCYLMKGVHIGHDAIVGNSVTLSCKAIVGGHTVIEDDCNIGLGAILHQKQHISKGVMVGMGSVITKKLQTEPFKTYVGNPAKLLGDNDKHPKFGEYTINMRDSI